MVFGRGENCEYRVVSYWFLRLDDRPGGVGNGGYGERPEERMRDGYGGGGAGDGMW